MKKILLINGPNMNLLGTREPGSYGATTLEQVVGSCKKLAKELGLELNAFQSNVEGELVAKIQEALEKEIVGIIINPAAYTHTSVAIRDAIAAVGKPTIEVHVSNIFAREDFRHQSYVSPVARGVISGLGVDGYLLAIRALAGIAG